MRKLFFSFILITFGFRPSAQILNSKDSKNFFGLHIQNSLNAPLFLSYYQLNEDNKGWGLRFGFGRESEAGQIYLRGDRFGSSSIGRTDYIRRAEYFYLVPQYVAYTKHKKRSTFMLAFGLPLGYSKDWLNQSHVNDPIKGTYNTYLREENRYAGVEVELAFCANVGKTMAFKYGMSTGIKLIGDAPFQDVFENYNFSKVYYPGMYKASYINFQIGLLFSQFGIK